MPRLNKPQRLMMPLVVLVGGWLLVAGLLPGQTLLRAQQLEPTATPSPVPPAKGLIAYRDGFDLFTINDNGTQKKRIGDAKKYLYMCPAWSRDGRTLALVGASDGFELLTMSASGGGQKTLVKANESEMPGTSPAWAPDGKQLLYAGKSGTRLFSLGTDGKSAPAAVEVAMINLDWSPDGMHIVAFGRADGKTGLYTFTPAGEDLRLLLELPVGDWERSFDKDHYFTRDVIWPHWSPDGTQIVFASAKDGNLELYTMDADGQNVQRLTNNDVPDLSPSWSASGESVIFVSERDGDKGIYVMDANPEDVRLVTPFRDGGCPAWQPKARR